MSLSFFSRSARVAAACAGRSASTWLVLWSTTTIAILPRLSRSSPAGLDWQVPAARAKRDRPQKCPGERRKSNNPQSATATATASQYSGIGSMGEKSTDQCDTGQLCFYWPRRWSSAGI